MDVHCPSATSNSCSITCSRFNTTGCFNISLFVSDLYTYGYLSFAVEDEPVNDTIGDDIITIHCNSDFKQQSKTSLLYIASRHEFQCIDESASACCPFGTCIE